MGTTVTCGRDAAPPAGTYRGRDGAGGRGWRQLIRLVPVSGVVHSFGRRLKRNKSFSKTHPLEEKAAAHPLKERETPTLTRVTNPRLHIKA